MAHPFGRIRSNQTRGWRKVASQGITSDGTLIQTDLPRGAAVEGALVVVSGNANITTTFTSVRSNAASKYVRRIDWLLNGNITLDSLTGYGAFLAHSFLLQKQATSTDPATFGVGTPAFRTVIPLWRTDPNFVRPKDSVQKTDANIGTNQLRVQLGNLSDMFVVGAGVANYSGQTVTYSCAVQDYQEAQDAAGHTPIPMYYWKRTEQLNTIAGSGTGIIFRVNTGNRLRGLIIVPQDATNSEPATTVISRVRVVRSGDTRYDLSQDLFQPLSLNALLNPAGLGTASLNANDTDSTVFAPIWIDFVNPNSVARVCKYSECWPVPANADVQLQIDASAAGNFRLITIEGIDLHPTVTKQ